MNSNGKLHPKTLLATVAHPDDETFAIGGTLALYASRGVDVHVIVATNGEEGTVSEEDLGSYSSVAELRVEKELQCAAEKLGLDGVHILGYRDSGMAGSQSNLNPDCLNQAPIEEVASKIAVYIRQLRPQVIITHDPTGGYNHPDHIALHQATLKAFEMAADPSVALEDLPPYQAQSLYYNIFPRRFLRFAIRLMPFFGLNPRQFGRNKDIDLLELAGEENFPVHAVIDYHSVVDIKQKASECHQSQLASGPPSNWLFSLYFRLMGDKDRYTRAYPPSPDRKVKDLFSGI
jgi:N-acetyl-1-D-myo-inositol-2-amino-2-deoxy-alpha-D-glucopyranoside deacetylase